MRYSIATRQGAVIRCTIGAPHVNTISCFLLASRREPWSSHTDYTLPFAQSYVQPEPNRVSPQPAHPRQGNIRAATPDALQDTGQWHRNETGNQEKKNKTNVVQNKYSSVLLAHCMKHPRVSPYDSIMRHRLSAHTLETTSSLRGDGRLISLELRPHLPPDKLQRAIPLPDSPDGHAAQTLRLILPFPSGRPSRHGHRT